MKTVPAETCDFDGPYTRPRQVPETDFEKAILRRVIESAVGPFNAVRSRDPQLTFQEVQIDFSADAPWSDDGWLSGYVTIPVDHDLNSIWGHDYIPIRFSVVEREYPASEYFRIVIEWEIDESKYGPAQSNEWPYPPVLGYPTCVLE